LLGSARDRFRVEYSRTEDPSVARQKFIESVKEGEFEGRFYRVTEEHTYLPDGRVELTAVARSGKHELAKLRFDPETGQGEFDWLETAD